MSCVIGFFAELSGLNKVEAMLDVGTFTVLRSIRKVVSLAPTGDLMSIVRFSWPSKKNAWY
jgi:hypothetical protein